MELLNHVAVLKYQRTGSSYTCDPPVLTTDEDWVVLIAEELDTDFSYHLMRNNFVYDDYEKYTKLAGKRTSEFVSWRAQQYNPRDFAPTNDNRNLIVTSNREWYELFVEATEIAKEENLLRKEDRVALFELIMKRFNEDRKETPSEKTKDWTLVEEFNQRLQTQQANYNQFLATQRTSPRLWGTLRNF